MTAPSLSSGDTSVVSMPSFASFYRAINRREAFPWQLRLAQQIADTEMWPAEVGVPTGLGKTACLDIAVWWLASQACRTPSRRATPTRIWWVVNRRILVDSTADHAKNIRDKLRASVGAKTGTEEEQILAAVARRLCMLAAYDDAPPLEVIQLRGGVRTRTPIDPAQPAIVLSTLPMYGSRLLFRGYGSSRKMRPIDAAMAGTDSLVLLDEAHLAPHLLSLCDALEECAPREKEVLRRVRCRPRIVSLTATGRAEAESRFDLDDRDYAHPIVRQRLDAPKPIRLVDCEARQMAKTLANAMKGLLADASRPATGVVFANTPKTARKAFKELEKQMSGSAEVVLLTGRIREREAKRIRCRILDPEHGMAAGRDIDHRRERHLVAVATQTLEVGADIDAEYLVTENCGVRALTQRLGRVNRLGRHPHAAGVYVHAPPASRRTSEWPVYREEPKDVKDRLEQAKHQNSGGIVDLGARHIQDVLGDPCDDPGRAPEIMFGLLWEWIKTTTPPSGVAPVEPYFSGVAGVDRRVSLIWRVHIPDPATEDARATDSDSSCRLWPRARNAESVSVPIAEFREALDPDDTIHRLHSDRETLEAVGVDQLRPGDTIVLPANNGLLDKYGWNPSSHAPVMDMSLLGNGLPLDREAIIRLCQLDRDSKHRSLKASISEDIRTVLGASQSDDESDSMDQERAKELAGDRILASIRQVDVPSGWNTDEWKDFVDSLVAKVVEPANEVARFRAGSDKGKVADGEERKSDEFDELSMVRQSSAISDRTLDRHCADVGMRACAIAERLGLPTDLRQVIERAGLLHDLGKRDERFQQWMDPDRKHKGIMLAKSNIPANRWERARANANWPRGARHETLSKRLVEEWLEHGGKTPDGILGDLLLHLIVSHHGEGRPLVRSVVDGTHGEVSADIDGHTVHASSELSLIDWEQPARFRRLNDEFGPWGLALLEAILRRADHAVTRGSATISRKRNA